MASEINEVGLISRSSEQLVELIDRTNNYKSKIFLLYDLAVLCFIFNFAMIGGTEWVSALAIWRRSVTYRLDGCTLPDFI